MQKNWRQKAKIKLFVDKVHVDNWSSEKEAALREFILREFHMDEGRCKVIINVSARQEIFVEFTVALMDDSVSALNVAKLLELNFFNLKIYRREESFVTQ